jgi:hypothetical protein
MHAQQIGELVLIPAGLRQLRGRRSAAHRLRIPIIPTGLHHSAQGLRGTSYPGLRFPILPTLKGLHQFHAADSTIQHFEVHCSMSNPPRHQITKPGSLLLPGAAAIHRQGAKRTHTQKGQTARFRNGNDGRIINELVTRSI